MAAGPKTKLTDELIQQAAALKRRGTNNQDICSSLGIHEATFYRWIENGGKGPKGRELCEALKKAESDYKTALRVKIEKQGDKDWKAYAWLLERQFPAEYGRVDRVQAEVQQTTQARVQVEYFFDYGDDDGEEVCEE